MQFKFRGEKTLEDYFKTMKLKVSQHSIIIATLSYQLFYSVNTKPCKTNL